MEMKVIDDFSYFSGDELLTKFYLLATCSKQDILQYHTTYHSWRDFMLYLLPLQSNGEIMLEVLSFSSVIAM